MSGPSTFRGAGDDLCLERFADGRVCRRPDDHPSIAEDGIGHNTSPIPTTVRVEAVQDQVADEMKNLRGRLAAKLATMDEYSKDLTHELGEVLVPLDAVVRWVQEEDL